MFLPTRGKAAAQLWRRLGTALDCPQWQWPSSPAAHGHRQGPEGTACDSGHDEGPAGLGPRVRRNSKPILGGSLPPDPHKRREAQTLTAPSPGPGPAVQTDAGR